MTGEENHKHRSFLFAPVGDVKTHEGGLVSVSSWCADPDCELRTLASKEKALREALKKFPRAIPGCIVLFETGNDEDRLIAHNLVDRLIAEARAALSETSATPEVGA